MTPDAPPAVVATHAAAPPPAFPAAAAGPSLALPALLLGALAVAALLLARRRRVLAPTRLVEVLETASLGPRRAIVVARVQGELLVLGSSEAGIALLATRPAPAGIAAPAATATAAATPAPAPGLVPGFAAVVARILPRRLAREPDGDAARFQAALAESLEDQELRRKLSGGRSGVVR